MENVKKMNDLEDLEPSSLSELNPDPSSSSSTDKDMSDDDSSSCGIKTVGTGNLPLGLQSVGILAIKFKRSSALVAANPGLLMLGRRRDAVDVSCRLLRLSLEMGVY